MSPVINKFLVAIATVLAALVAMLGDNDLSSFTTSQWLTLAIVALGALGVYAIPNASRRS